MGRLASEPSAQHCRKTAPLPPGNANFDSLKEKCRRSPTLYKFPDLRSVTVETTFLVMYGMVNQAIEQMVCETHGEEAWEKIKEMAGIDVDVFISNEGYPDDYTYRLVAAASELSKTPADEILEAFGEHWVLRTAMIRRTRTAPRAG